MKSLLKRFVATYGGTTAIEYAMVGPLISVLILAAVTTIGTSLSSIFTTVFAGLWRQPITSSGPNAKSRRPKPAGLSVF